MRKVVPYLSFFSSYTWYISSESDIFSVYPISILGFVSLYSGYNLLSPYIQYIQQIYRFWPPAAPRHTIRRGTAHCIDLQHLCSIYHGMHTGYPMFIQYLSLYWRTLWSLFVHIPLPLWAVPHAHPLCGSLPARDGASPALPPVSGRERDIYYPYKYRQHQWAKFPHGSTDSTYAAARRGSNVYEVNLWLWQFGRASLSLGGFRWQTQKTVELSSRQTVSGMLRHTSAALRGRVRSDLALKKAGCAKIYHVYPILIWQPQR